MEKLKILTKREKQIVSLIIAAKCRKNIARDLNISIHTVDTHLRHIHLKTNTHSIAEIMVWARSKLDKQFVFQ